MAWRHLQCSDALGGVGGTVSERNIRSDHGSEAHSAAEFGRIREQVLVVVLQRTVLGSGSASGLIHWLCLRFDPNCASASAGLRIRSKLERRAQCCDIRSAAGARPDSDCTGPLGALPMRLLQSGCSGHFSQTTRVGGMGACVCVCVWVGAGGGGVLVDSEAASTWTRHRARMRHAAPGTDFVSRPSAPSERCC